MLLHKTADGVVAALVSMLITKPLEQPHGRMTLLRRFRFIDFQDLPNAIQHQREFWKTLRRPPPVLLRLTVSLQHLTHFVTRMMKLSRDLMNTHQQFPVTEPTRIVFGPS